MTWQDHITVDPQVCHGKACFKGTRIMVSSSLTTSRLGSTRRVLAATLAGRAIHAAIATQIASERIFLIPGDDAA
jgi:uncharacterized protein (DUF433 family)